MYKVDEANRNLLEIQRLQIICRLELIKEEVRGNKEKIINTSVHEIFWILREI